MTNNDLDRMVRRYFAKTTKDGFPPLPPWEAKVVTGNQYIDNVLHLMLVENGIEVILGGENSANTIIDYHIVNEQKFAWFVLKWS